MQASLGRSSSPQFAPSLGDGHVAALDGLRGIAATVVVLSHSFLAMDMPDDSRRALMRSPLALLLNGQSAVQVFFVLSGFVLALSLTRGRGALHILQFYIKRIFRIEPPYVCGVLFAWGASALYIAAAADHGFTPWVAQWMSNGLSPRRLHVLDKLYNLLPHLAFPGAAAGLLNVGWTLRIEMIFSFLLPLMVVLARPLHGLPLLGASAVLLLLPQRFLTAWFAFDFALGVVAFQERAPIQRALAAAPVWTRRGLLIVALVLLAAPFLFTRESVWDTLLIGTPHGVLVMGLGAVLLVASALTLPAVGRVISWSPCRFLGRISYSLYLVHFTVLLLVASVLTRLQVQPPGLLFAAAVLAPTITLSVLSQRFVERPSIRVGNQLCRWLASPLRSHPTTR